MTVTLTLTQPTKKPVSVSYATREFTARAGLDYVATRGTAIIAAGAQSVTFTVAILSNQFTKADTTFFIDLKSASNATLMTKSVRCSIT